MDAHPTAQSLAYKKERSKRCRKLRREKVTRNTIRGWKKQGMSLVPWQRR